MKKSAIAIFILTTLYFILNTFPILAQSKILLNEFLIDPQPQAVEIFNSGTESADISDWIIDDSGGTTFYTIPKDSIISPNQCLVFSGDFNLNKASPDTVRLINSSLQLIDSFSYKLSSGSGISYLRQPDGTNNWTTASANLGKFNSNTEQACLSPTLIPTLTPTPEPTLTITPIITWSEDPTPTQLCTGQACLTPTIISQSYGNIYLSEAMVNPPTGEKEWVEIYNDNDFSVSLINWYIDDQESAGSSPKIFSLIINAKSYGVVDLTSSIFNNDGDSVRLLDFNKDIKDDFEYQKTEAGKTLGRSSLESDNFCLQEPSKNSSNNPCINPTQTSFTPTPTPLLPTQSGFAGQAPTKVVQNSFDVSIHRSINYPTGITYNTSDDGDVLGITSDTLNSYPLLLRTLSAISFSYSLLTIISILFKMKLSYGKNKNFYSSFIHSS
ncbi:MAG: lamin tail domain-containing protein [Patescibacteria group bacterium]